MTWDLITVKLRVAAANMFALRDKKEDMSMYFIGLAAGCDNAAEIIPLKDAVNMSATHGLLERERDRGWVEVGLSPETGNILLFKNHVYVLLYAFKNYAHLCSPLSSHTFCHTPFCH